MTQRLRPLPPDQLDEAQRALYEEITGGRRGQGPQAFPLVDSGGGLVGPFNAMLLEPVIGTAFQGLGLAVRYETHLSDAVREMVILAAAYEIDSEFEQWAHEAIARGIGVTDDDLDRLRAGELPASLDETGQMHVASARLLARGESLTDEQYAAAVAVIGERGLYELTVIVGYYACLAMQLNVFGVKVPEHG